MEIGTRIAQTGVISLEQADTGKAPLHQAKTSQEAATNRQANRLMIAFVMLLGGLYAARIGPPVTYPAWGLDNSMYLVSAKALSEGHGYHLINHPDAPVANMFPIGYPAVLAVALKFVALDATGITFLRSLSAFACLVFLWLGYRLLRRYLAPKRAAVMTFLIGLIPWVMFWSGQIFSECFFALWTTAAVLLATKSVGEESESDSRWWLNIALAGLFAGLAMLTRTVGFTVIGGIGLTLLVNRNWRKLSVFAVTSGLVMVPWLVWSILSAPGGGSVNNYMGWVSNHFGWRKPAANLWSLISQDAPFLCFAPGGTPVGQDLLAQVHLAWLFPAMGLLVSLIFLIGLVILLKRRDVVAWCLVSYLSVVILYPFEGTFRFLMPIYPLLAVPFITGARLLWQRRQFLRVPQKVLSAALIILLILNGLSAGLVDFLTVANVYAFGHFSGPLAARNWKDITAANEWIKQNVPEDGVVVSVYAYGVYLFTNRATISTLFTDRVNSGVGSKSETVSKLEDVLSEVSPDKPLFVFALESDIGLGEEVSLAPLKAFLSEHPERAKLRWEIPEHKIMIYEIVQAEGSKTGS
ncbi:MAG: glycosyltransferase family 39 protein [Acidobacteria bacterium]|nr:glycosyltransferase family 39 protein [Acidobacteriota bacterium]